MRAQGIHHLIGIRIGVTTAEAYQMHRITGKICLDPSCHMMRAFDQVSYNNHVADTFAPIFTKVSPQAIYF
jgi:hypothetical protein